MHAPAHLPSPSRQPQRGWLALVNWLALWWPGHAVVQTSRPLLRLGQPADAAALQRFYTTLSSRSLGWRFHCGMARLPAARAAQLCQACLTQPLQAQSLLVVRGAGPQTPAWATGPAHEQTAGPNEVLAHASWHVDGPERAEFALVVADGQQGQGLGSQLMLALVARAAQRGIRQLHASVLQDNHAMRALLRHPQLRAGLRWHTDRASPELLQVVLDTTACGATAAAGGASGHRSVASGTCDHDTDHDHHHALGGLTCTN